MFRRIIIITIITLSISAMVFLLYRLSYFNASFATNVSLRYKYGEKDIYEEINDPLIIDELKSILRGLAHPDNPSCGFSIDISITLYDGNNSVTICPALDRCETMRIGDSNRYFYISENDRRRLDNILKKYGFSFPAI